MSAELHSGNLILGIKCSKISTLTYNSDLMVSTSEFGSGDSGSLPSRAKYLFTFQLLKRRIAIIKLQIDMK